MSFVVCEESPFTTFWLKLEGFYFLNSEMKQWWKHGMNEKFGQKREKSWKKGQRIDEKSYNPISILWWVSRINQLLSHTGDFSMGVERLKNLQLYRGSLNVSWTMTHGFRIFWSWSCSAKDCAALLRICNKKLKLLVFHQLYWSCNEKSFPLLVSSA